MENGPAPRPRVTVVVPHYDDLPGLALLLADLRAQDVPAAQFQVRIADNNSRCGIEAVRALAAEHGRGLDLRVVPAPEQGAGPARNAAVAAGSGALLAFIDSDCRPAPGWLSAGTAALAHHDLAGGHVLATAADPARPTPVEAFEIVFAFDFERYVTREGYAGTGNLFATRAAFDLAGPFRATVAEDMEWCRRATSRGLRLGYAPDAVVRHPARTSWAELERRWRRMEAEHWALALEAPRGRARWLAKALAMPFSAVPHGARVLASPRLPDARARLGALAVLTRLRLWRAREMLRLFHLPLEGGGRAVGPGGGGDATPPA